MQREEMLGSAMLAFYEAIGKYDPGKGHFLPFANVIVRERLIDYNRKELRRSVPTVPLEEDDNDGSAQSDVMSELSFRAYEANRRQEVLVDEIEQFKAELDTWGLTFSALVEQSPKHDKLREEYKLIISGILRAPDIIQTIQIKRYFPIKAIGEVTGTNKKKLERARNFILASLIIKLGDYDLLSDYVAGPDNVDRT